MNFFINKKMAMLLAAISAVSVFFLGSGVAEAIGLMRKYESDTDTGTSALDFIENRDRLARIKRESEDIKKLRADIAALKKSIAEAKATKNKRALLGKDAAAEKAKEQTAEEIVPIEETAHDEKAAPAEEKSTVDETEKVADEREKAALKEEEAPAAEDSFPKEAGREEENSAGKDAAEQTAVEEKLTEAAAEETLEKEEPAPIQKAARPATAPKKPAKKSPPPPKEKKPRWNKSKNKGKNQAAKKSARGQKEDPPLAFEGDDIFYDQLTGKVFARGHVVITRIDGKRLITEQADGDLSDKKVKIQDKGRLINITPGETVVELDGYRTVYDYGSSLGSMEEAKGKIDGRYVTGKRVEIYPDEVVIYEGTMTYCSAGRPDYHLSARRIEIWQDTMIMDDVKFWLRNVQIGRRRRIVRDLTKPAPDPYYPSVGYNSKVGFYIKDRFSWEVIPQVEAFADLYYSNRRNSRSHVGLKWENRGFSAAYEYGKFGDSDDGKEYLNKEPNYTFSYRDHIGHGPYSYNLSYELGDWNQGSLNSVHREYKLTISRKPYVFFKKLTWTNSIGYQIVKESSTREIKKRSSHTKTETRGMTYDSSLLYSPNDYFTVFTSYSYSKMNAENALFDYNVENYSELIKYGLSWRLGPKDRIVFAESLDTQGGHLNEIDYFWFHNFHCAELIVNYNFDRYDDDRTIHLKLQFAPW